ncbi:alkaline phosphatase D family protein [Shewanella algae]|uniref:alkaline phosphatase D family protein n=1 Tax=Shewanella algae TaxID=38313 RepID=UPI001182E3B9|nr:alkaline phosphatase D family protein [Shewanella algae]MBO2593042.1 alkaline phosphatase family protein [Shewanella algae]TVL00761.1 metallophosphatase [Shewanella algae]
MSKKLILGPVLGLESDTLYTVTFISDKNASQASVTYADGQETEAVLIGEIYSGHVWRAVLTVAMQDKRHVNYSISVDAEPAEDKACRTFWTFYVPGANEKPKFAYASCNGFSDYKMLTTTEQPYRLWKDMATEHFTKPFSLLLLGGDQVYADSMWTTLSTLKAWNELPREEKVNRKATKDMRTQLNRFYSELYVDRWNKEPIAHMLASIPSIMMWDDHDIFDGWGSYPDDLQKKCDVYQAIFAAARKHFSLLQVRGRDNTSLLATGDNTHFSMAVHFRGYNILALDNRSERTLLQVMSSEQWKDIKQYLENDCNHGDLLVMTAVPVVYRDFSFAESVVDSTPWEEELTDDLKDHWRAKEHEGERLKLIMALLDNAKIRNTKTVLLSGDVHVGCLGIIRDLRSQQPISIHQVVSSGIVHPAPTYLEWLGILAVTNDDLEYLEETRSITADMLKPQGSNKYIRARNFVTLLEGTDAKLWVNWINESKDKPAFPLQ